MAYTRSSEPDFIACREKLRSVVTSRVTVSVLSCDFLGEETDSHSPEMRRRHVVSPIRCWPLAADTFHAAALCLRRLRITFQVAEPAKDRPLQNILSALPITTLRPKPTLVGRLGRRPPTGGRSRPPIVKRRSGPPIKWLPPYPSSCTFPDSFRAVAISSSNRGWTRNGTRRTSPPPRNSALTNPRLIAFSSHSAASSSCPIWAKD